MQIRLIRLIRVLLLLLVFPGWQRQAEFLDLLVEVTFDVVARNSHGHMPLAGAGAIDLHIELERNPFFFGPNIGGRSLGFVGGVVVFDPLTGQERWRYRAEAPYVHQGVCLNQPVTRATGRNRWPPVEVRRSVDGRV